MTACFENFLVPQESLISWNIIFKRQRFINVLESFSYKDSLFIPATQGKKGSCSLMTCLLFLLFSFMFGLN
jgi:hypothetical protein